MIEPVKISRYGDVQVATFSNPPVNAISAAVREALAAVLTQASNDPAVSALVLSCAGKTFFSGADIREFGKPSQLPTLPQIVTSLIAASKPVVAAIHGQALGGGLELAMACQGRVVTRTAKLGLPEVKLGLLPGAGGTQFLPRLIDPVLALEMIGLGEPIDAVRAVEIGLADRCCEESQILTAAIALARALAGEQRDRVASRPFPIGMKEAVQAFARKHARRFRMQLAPQTILDLLSASASLSFDEGMALERMAFERLRDGAQSKALRHLFAAERACARLTDLDGVAPRVVETVAVIGGGTMGSGIAIAALMAGYPVTMVERDEAALEAGQQRVMAALAKRGLEGRFEAFATSLDWDQLAVSDLIIEAAFEDMAVKQDIFRRLGQIARPDAILATNTSYLDVDAIATASGRPHNVVGLHFFSPAEVMKLLEIVRGESTDPDCLATALAFAKRIGKVPVVARNGCGFIGNRMLAVRKREAEKLLLLCRSPERIDAALEAFGFPMGAFKVSDLAGLDLGWNEASADRGQLRDRLCLAGRKGRKTGAGYYDYGADGRPVPSAEAGAIIAAFADDQSIPRRDLNQQEIVDALLLPMISEAKRILDEGIARSPADIDVVWTNGYGWPRWTGGPMFWREHMAP